MLIFAGVHDALFSRKIYCANPNHEPDTHSGSRVLKGLGYQALWSTLDYDLTTTISIWPLPQYVRYKMGLSVFASTSQPKVVIKTTAS